MDWIAAALQTFGRTLGIDDLALDDEGLVAFTFEDGGELALQDLHPLGGNEFLVSLAKPGAGDAHRALRAALAAADHRRGHPWAVQVGLDGGDLLVTLRLPRSALMPSSLEEAVVRVQRYHREVALGFERRVRQAPSAPPLKIDRGIEKILRASVKRGGERLAVGGQYAPAYSPMRQRLDQLYAMPNLDDYLIEEMAPAVGEGSLLLPHRFAQGLQAALTLLEREAARDEQKRHARVLQRAIDVLSDQLALRDLLRAYVSALYKG